jgi:hypothetical protein
VKSKRTEDQKNRKAEEQRSDSIARIPYKEVLPRRGRNMPAQGNALGLKSRPITSPERARHGHGDVSPFQGLGLMSDRIPGRCPGLYCGCPFGATGSRIGKDKGRKLENRGEGETVKFPRGSVLPPFCSSGLLLFRSSIRPPAAHFLRNLLTFGRALLWMFVTLVAGTRTTLWPWTKLENELAACCCALETKVCGADETPLAPTLS